VVEVVKKKPVVKALVYGLLSTILYYLLLTKQNLYAPYFTKGGVYAFLIILTAFIFSFVHGTFTDYFWKVLGIEPKKRREVK
jgi:glucan phosphoethanolaminetransferase (alkaline phosphatase superfamily)